MAINRGIHSMESATFDWFKSKLSINDYHMHSQYAPNIIRITSVIITIKWFPIRCISSSAHKTNKINVECFIRWILIVYTNSAKHTNLLIVPPSPSSGCGCVYEICMCVMCMRVSRILSLGEWFLSCAVDWKLEAFVAKIHLNSEKYRNKSISSWISK